MNISLRSRLSASFIVVNVLVVALGLTVFFYFDSLNNDIRKLNDEERKISEQSTQVQDRMFTILENQRKISLKQDDDLEELLGNTHEAAGLLTEELKKLDLLYTDTEVKKIISKIQGYTDSLKIIVGKNDEDDEKKPSATDVTVLVDKIFHSHRELEKRQDIQRQQRGGKLHQITEDTKKTMMIILVSTFLFTTLLGLLIPSKIALPFKKIKDVLRELQECNFDVSIFYDQKDEIGEIAQEMNKMIQSIKKFEELRVDRIAIEHKKFDTLASLAKKYVLVADAKGELIYMNNQLYSLMDISSDEVLHKDISDILIPKSVRSVYETAIKRRTKNRKY